MNLNERQRRYLLAALAIDQSNESLHKYAFQRGDYEESKRKASDWRAMPFGMIYESGAAIPTMLRRECKTVDEGSGSTWAALERKGLLTVENRDVHMRPGQNLPHITLTRQGRKMARELKGEKPEVKVKGQVSRSTWKALAAGWKAGVAGLWDERGGDWYGGVSGDTWRMLADRGTWFAYIQRVTEEQGYEYGVQITYAGIAKYWNSWEVNSAKYPDIDAPKPTKKRR